MRWISDHPCLLFADLLYLRVVAENTRVRMNVRETSAINFSHDGRFTSFGAWVPVPDAGKWTFRVVSVVNGVRTNIGTSSPPISFAEAGFLALLVRWSPFIATAFVSIAIIGNLFILAVARYSADAWRLATDSSWGKTVLGLQMLLLRHSKKAQLWILDLYVQKYRAAPKKEQLPFLPLPTTNSGGEVVASDIMIVRLASQLHLWVQGNTGMGKTAIFSHLVQMHFGGPETTSFAIFRRHGYLLIAIEARRFPKPVSENTGPSGWVLACIQSVLSEHGLLIADRYLLRAMLSKGTLAVAIDGLNEVAHAPAVIAFAAEFPGAPLFVTSQEAGEQPFEVWHLPSTMRDHILGILGVYLGRENGDDLAKRVQDTGLIQYLRSGYDIRLVILLAGTCLPRDLIGLYHAAVAAAWPPDDPRQELLQAAAWKLFSDRGPNEDKRRLLPDVDAPSDLLQALEAVRQRWHRTIRLIRSAPPGYEFVHDQMSAYLAAGWLTDRPNVLSIYDALNATKAWMDGRQAQQTLWGFVAALLDRSRLEALWIFAGDDERRAVLGRALTERAEREGWSLTRPPVNSTTIT